MVVGAYEKAAHVCPSALYKKRMTGHYQDMFCLTCSIAYLGWRVRLEVRGWIVGIGSGLPR